MCTIVKPISTFVLVACLLLFSAAEACESSQQSFFEVRGDGEGLVEGPFSVEVLEKKHVSKGPNSEKMVPFGGLNQEWEQLKALKLPTDEIYWVLYTERGDRDRGTNFYENYVLVREGCVIKAITLQVGFEGDERT